MVTGQKLLKIAVEEKYWAIYERNSFVWFLAKVCEEANKEPTLHCSSDPLCSVLIVFSSQMAVFKCAPALLCGNTFIFKPAQLTPSTAFALAEIFSEAGLPPGVFNVVQGAGETGQALCAHPEVNKISFTGGIRSGSLVMRSASERTVPVTLELGGKSALIIFEDADIDEAVKVSCLPNAGPIFRVALAFLFKSHSTHVLQLLVVLLTPRAGTSVFAGWSCSTAGNLPVVLRFPRPRLSAQPGNMWRWPRW